MNIFGFFLFLRFHTYYKSADDIKKIHNLMAPGQVTLLMFSSILVLPQCVAYEHFYDITHCEVSLNWVVLLMVLWLPNCGIVFNYSSF